MTFTIHLTGPRIEDAACDALLGEVMAKSPDHRQAGTIAGRLITKKGRLL